MHGVVWVSQMRESTSLVRRTIGGLLGTLVHVVLALRCSLKWMRSQDAVQNVYQDVAVDILWKYGMMSS